MSNWFTVETIDKSTYAISEYGHWEQVHSYLIIGSEKAILLDTGLGVGNIKSIVDTLTTLPIEVVTTHVHWDHIGGHHYFSNISVHENEKSWIEAEFPLPLKAVKANLMKEACKFPETFDCDGYQVFQGKVTRALHDKDEIELGNRKLCVMHTPGHSPGHICLYEEQTGYLFSGDLIYKGKLDAFYPTTDPNKFMHSVDRIAELPIKRILPSHYDLDIDTGIINRIQQAFEEIKNAGKLAQGQGTFLYDSFSIHL